MFGYYKCFTGNGNMCNKVNVVKLNTLNHKLFCTWLAFFPCLEKKNAVYTQKLHFNVRELCFKDA